MDCSIDNLTAQAMTGSTGEATLVVAETDTAIAAGSGDLPVLATPTMIALMEAAACRALDGHLAPGRSSVGTRVDVRHLAPSPVGATVTARAEIVDVQGARVTFTVSACQPDGEESVQVGRGTHVRVIVDREVFLNGA